MCRYEFRAELSVVAVLGHDVRVVEYQGQRVVTLRQIDELHERPTKAALKQFIRHRARHAEGVDYFKVNGSEIRTHLSDAIGDRGAPEVILITERGYGKIVKGWNDDRSWALLDAMQDTVSGS